MDVEDRMALMERRMAGMERSRRHYRLALVGLALVGATEDKDAEFGKVRAYDGEFGRIIAHRVSRPSL
jgi:hypothetical protein